VAASRGLHRRIIILAIVGSLPLVAGLLHPLLYAAYAAGAPQRGGWTGLEAVEGALSGRPWGQGRASDEGGERSSGRRRTR
jgi:hypothetical protein